MIIVDGGHVPLVEAVVVAAVRTPIGAHGGALKDVRADDLAALVIQEVVKRGGVEPEIIEEVYFGCANQAGEDNRNVARMATLLAGLPSSVAAVTFNRLCASGLAAINAAARAIAAGEGRSTSPAGWSPCRGPPGPCRRPSAPSPGAT